jgi:NAD(P)-dependent dehydrogenase (short-subunit alcohol dehydrogenase family)
MSKTVIVTGASQGIGAGAVKAFLDKGYNVVATSRSVTKSRELPSSPKLALVDGDIGDASVAAKVSETAVSKFGLSTRWSTMRASSFPRHSPIIR